MAQCFSENKHLPNGDFYNGVFTDSLYGSSSGSGKPEHYHMHPTNSTDKGHRRTFTDSGIPRSMNGASRAFDDTLRRFRDIELPKDFDFKRSSSDFGNIKQGSNISNGYGKTSGLSSKPTHESGVILYESRDEKSMQARQSITDSFDANTLNDLRVDADFNKNERRDYIGIQRSSRFSIEGDLKKGEMLPTEEAKPMHSHDHSTAYDKKSRPISKNPSAGSSEEDEVRNNLRSRLRSRNLSEGNFSWIFSGENVENSVNGRKLSVGSLPHSREWTASALGNLRPMYANRNSSDIASGGGIHSGESSRWGTSGTKPNYANNPQAKAVEHDADRGRDSRILSFERTTADGAEGGSCCAEKFDAGSEGKTFNSQQLIALSMPITEASFNHCRDDEASKRSGANAGEISENLQNVKANHHAGEILPIKDRGQNLNDVKISEGRFDQKVSTANGKLNGGCRSFTQGTLIVGKSSERSDGNVQGSATRTSFKTISAKDGDYVTTLNSSGHPKQEMLPKHNGSARFDTDAYKTGRNNIFVHGENVLLRKAFSSKDAEEVKIIGNEQYRKGHFAEALILYERAIYLAPSQASYHSNRAAALSALGRLVDAVKECEEAIKLDSAYIRARRRLVSLFLRLGKIENAKAQFYAAGQKINAGDLEQIQNIERRIDKCYGARKITDWQTVLRESDAAILAGADAAPEVLALKAEALLSLRRPDEAAQVLCIAQKLETAITKAGVALPDSTVLIVQARLDLSQGRYKEALVAAEKAAQWHPNNAEVSSFLKMLITILKARKMGNELFKEGKYFEASAAYGEGLEADSRNAILLCNRAACRFNIGLWEKSIEDCDAALEAQPNYIKASLRRAHSYAKLEKWEEALRDFEAVKRELPGDVEVARALFGVHVALQKENGQEISKVQFGELEEVSGINQFSKAISSPGLVVVQFITRWSEECKQFVPFVDQLCKIYPAVNFLTVDIGKIPYLAKSESINSVPMLKIYKNGQKVQELRGSSHQDLEQAIQQYTQ